jgi:peptidoglycan/LPS O-acetylase OafA/YrhL
MSFSKTSIDEALSGRRNSLGFLRLVMASLVILHHAYPLGGFGPQPLENWSQGQASIGTLCVGGFFAISGYVITKSGASGDFMQFIWRRFIRIFPAFWLVLIVTAFVVGPFIWCASGRSFESYFSTPGLTPYNYPASNWTLSIGAFGIHDIFAETTPYGRVAGVSIMNGSLWTLVYELNSYLVIGFLVFFGALQRVRWIVPALCLYTFSLLLLAKHSDLPTQIAPAFLRDVNMVTFLFTFLCGATLAMYSKKVPFSPGLGLMSALTLLATLRYGGYETIGIVAGVYLIMFLGAWLPEFTQRVGDKNDYSYGVYIYGFLVQQVFANFGLERFGFWPYAGGAWLVALGCAWISWHALEKWALRLRSWGPGRGSAYWLNQGAQNSFLGGLAKKPR